MRKKFNIKTLWKSLARTVYAIVGITASVSLVWGLVRIFSGTFFDTMGFFGSLGFFILVIGGLNWGIKSVLGKDLFGN
jgi:uncharacterized membrane protein YuzA (DUF378 family)